MNERIYSSLKHDAKDQEGRGRCEDRVCQLNGGVKVNPFFVREMRDTTAAMNQPEVALCDVLINSVVHTRRVAALHAEKAKCQHCANFASQLEAGLDHLTLLENEYPTIAGDQKKVRLVDNNTVERQNCISHLLYPLSQIVDLEKGEPQTLPSRSRVATVFRPRFEVRERRIKLMAYFSVVILAVLMLVIVVIVLTLFISQQPFLAFAA